MKNEQSEERIARLTLMRNVFAVVGLIGVLLVLLGVGLWIFLEVTWIP